MNAEIVAALAVHFANEGLPLDDRVKGELLDMRKAIEKLTKEVAELRKNDDVRGFATAARDLANAQLKFPAVEWSGWRGEAFCSARARDPKVA